MARPLTILAGALAWAAAASAAHAQTWPQQADYVCTATSSTGEKDDQRIQLDLKNKAWCTSKDACGEVKTIFGEQGGKVVLESSTLEVTSYESSIDRATGKYDSVIDAGGFKTESHGTCKVAAFTPFKVQVDGSKIRGG